MHFTDKLIQAIGWTLIHSLWQGLLLAIIIGFIIQFTKRTGPVLRYNLLLGSFIVFLLTCITTFCIEWESLGNVAHHSAAVLAQTGHGIINIPEREFTLVNQVVVYLNNNLSLIVVIWFILLSIKSVHFFYNVAQLQRIRNHNNYPAAEWDERLSVLAKKLGIAQKISLRESLTVKIPVVIGLFKPVILFPIGFLANLPADQVEAILLHELAHIRRKDYFVNMLQCIAEMIFFFNPAVLWISSLLREERENCCDDMAISITNKRSEFIHALVSFYEVGTGAKYAVQFPGQKYQLLNRVKRIMYRNNKVMTAGERIFFTISLFIVMFLMFGFNDKYQHKQQKKFVRTMVPFVLLKQQQKQVATAEPKKDTLTGRKSNKPKPAASKKTVEQAFDPKDLEALNDDYLDHKYNGHDGLKAKRQMESSSGYNPGNGSGNGSGYDFQLAVQVNANTNANANANTNTNANINTNVNIDYRPDKGTMFPPTQPAMPEAKPVKEAPAIKKRDNNDKDDKKDKRKLFRSNKSNLFLKTEKTIINFSNELSKKIAAAEWKIRDDQWKINEKKKEMISDRKAAIKEREKEKRSEHKGDDNCADCQEKEKKKGRKGDQKPDPQFRIV